MDFPSPNVVERTYSITSEIAFLRCKATEMRKGFSVRKSEEEGEVGNGGRISM